MFYKALSGERRLCEREEGEGKTIIMYVFYVA